MLTTDELKKMTDKELENESKKYAVEHLKFRLAVAARQSKETSKLKNLRKYIARIKTMKRMLELERVKENAKSSVIK
ncbi:50S ribosomal protein L29 [Candidatus Peregrinibacteria bacterium]|nr:50S ribosomal protein L29 [Candidatus Peregrinibacteria bacterium]